MRHLAAFAYLLHLSDVFCTDIFNLLMTVTIANKTKQKNGDSLKTFHDTRISRPVHQFHAV